VVIILKGSPFQGTVSLSAHGPFHTQDEAVQWALSEFEGQPEWYVVEVHHPGDYNASEEDEFENGEVVDLTGQELQDFEKMIDEAQRRRLAKQIMVDLSEIPTGV
jgi:hypothetical protein